MTEQEAQARFELLARDAVHALEARDDVDEIAHALDIDRAALIARVINQMERLALTRRRHEAVARVMARVTTR